VVPIDLPARAASVAKCGALTPAHWHTFFLAPPFVGGGGTQARFPIGAILQDLAQLQAPKDKWRLLRHDIISPNLAS